MAGEKAGEEMRSSVSARTECAFYHHRLCIHLFYSIDKLVLAQQRLQWQQKVGEKTSTRERRERGRQLGEMRQNLLRLSLELGEQSVAESVQVRE